MVREGECSVKSRCFDSAIAPLNMTAKAVTPSAVEGSRGWIGVNPYESHRRMFGELETFRLRYRSAQGDREIVTPTVEILAGCASRMEYVFSMPAHNGWGVCCFDCAYKKEEAQKQPL